MHGILTELNGIKDAKECWIQCFLNKECAYFTHYMESGNGKCALRGGQRPDLITFVEINATDSTFISGTKTCLADGIEGL